MTTTYSEPSGSHRRNQRIVWYTVGVVVILVAWSILTTVTFLMWWSTTPHAQE